jgi:hypothetical protein
VADYPGDDGGMNATVRECDGPGCTGPGNHRTPTGGHLCDHCNENREADEAACMAMNGASPPVAAPWWKKLLHRDRAA